MMNTSMRTLLIIAIGCLSLELGAKDLPKDTAPIVVPQLGSFEATDVRTPISPPNVTIDENYGQIDLSWTAVSGATRYIVEASDSPATDFVDITSTNVLRQLEGFVAWTTLDIPSYHFYRVTAVQDVPVESFVLVPGGTFNNGTSDVTISSFYMGKYELTQAGYQAVMGINQAFFQGVQNAPMESVSWFNAIEYCNRRSIGEAITPCYSYINSTDYGTDPADWPTGWNTLDANHTNVVCNWAAGGYRLPTEMEWMFAAKGGNLSNNYVYSGGDEINTVAWWGSYNDGNANNLTHPVGTKEPNELGLYDMSGNVAERVWDIRGEYPVGAQTDPHGASSGSARVLRGGSLISNSNICEVTYRSNGVSPSQNLYVFQNGFRICRNLP